MNQNELSINLLFPVLNERLRLRNGIEKSMAYLKGECNHSLSADDS